MKKLAFALIIIVGIALTVYVLKNLSQSKVVDTQVFAPAQNTSTNAPKWKSVQLHQDINIMIPQEWSAASDGVYNYDHIQATGIRDPNFPDNSFKCVFYKDEALRSKISIIQEQTLQTSPKVTYINAKWSDQNDENRLIKFGDVINLYTYLSNTEEIYIECFGFKGSMLAKDKSTLENIILSIQK